MDDHVSEKDKEMSGQHSKWDIETIVEQIWRDLNGSFPRAEIHEALKDIIPKYEKARIQTFVPILIRRDAAKRLKSMRARSTSPGMGVDEATKSYESLAKPDASQTSHS